MTGIRVFLLSCVLCFMATSSATATVLRTTVQSSDGEESVGLAIQISPEFVLTTHDLVSGSSQVVVQTDVGSTQHNAELKSIDPDAGLAILFVPGLKEDPATVAKSAPTPGRTIYLQSFDGPRYDGVYVGEFDDTTEQRRYRFSVSGDVTESGTPLMNSCNQLVAIGFSGANPSGMGTDQGVSSGTFPALVSFLLENGVDFQAAPERCPSLQDQNAEAIAAQEKLQAEKEVLTTDIEVLETEIEELQTEIEEGSRRSQEELETLESKRRELEAALNQKNSELTQKDSEAQEMAKRQDDLEERLQQSEERLRQSQEELQRREDELNDARESEEAAKERVERLTDFLVIAGVAVVAIALIVIAVMALRRRRPELANEHNAGSPEPDQPSSSPASNPIGPAGLSGAVPTVPHGTQLDDQSVSSEEPQTRIASGGFRPPSSGLHSPQRPLPAGGHSNVERTADDPVVGWLVVVDGPGKGAELVVGSGQNSLGRGGSTRIKINFGDDEISRSAHATITYDWKGNRFFLANGMGTNLTYIDGEAVLDPVTLETGSEFTIGRTTLRFVAFCDQSFRWSDVAED